MKWFAITVCVFNFLLSLKQIQSKNDPNKSSFCFKHVFVLNMHYVFYVCRKINMVVLRKNK